ncbi:hypothetical protein OKW96_09840 [Sphingobacterium sp. KU25419]|jgi:hypothetical protein|nr:hypothetical protein OKW96_09840 [Sphingobacterium sp. KU25419]
MDQNLHKGYYRQEKQQVIYGCTYFLFFITNPKSQNEGRDQVAITTVQKYNNDELDELDIYPTPQQISNPQSSKHKRKYNQMTI